jgi:signal transduction histidine kinase
MVDGRDGRQRERAGGRLGVRLTSALAAVTVVAVALAIAGVAFVVLHRRALTAITDTAVLDRAEAVAARLAAGDQAGVARLLQARPGDETVLQVVSPAGQVTAASAEITGEGPLSPLRPAPGAIQREDRRLPLGDEGLFRVVAVGVATPAGNAAVLAAQSLRPVDAAVHTEITLLAVGYPLLLLLVGAATAMFVGRSLRSVEAVRRRVASMTARQLHERVPVPLANDEIRRLAETMNAMLERLEAAATTQRRFVADASHELRSPLSSLQVGLELLETGRASADGATLAMLHDETDRLNRLVADLLLLARVDERGLAPRAEEVDLDDLLDAERVRLQAQPGPKVGTRIQPVKVRGDRGQLGRAIRNLVDNATRHAAGRVDLRLWSDGAAAHLEVADDGPGIPAADRERVFDRFVRLEGSRQRATGGSGLGLAIVHEIIIGHRGAVIITDTAGGGATFEVTLPLAGPPRG